MEEFKQSNPLISVIVPIYNVERFLPRCIESILAQTYKNLEIILVDDGSTDSCPQLCDKYLTIDDRVKVIHKKNAGLGRARNSGLEIATGQYITFVDSDDAILPQMYEILYKSLLKTGADISACTRMQVEEDDDNQNIVFDINHEMKRVKIYTGKEATKELLQGHWIFKNAVWEKLYKRYLFDDIKFRSVYAEDREIMYKLLYAAETVCHIPLALYCYRQRQGSTMLSKWNTHKDDMVYEQDNDCFKFFLSKGEEELYKAAVYWHFFWGIENYRRLEGQEPKYRERIKKEMKPFASCSFLLNTDYPIRRKIEFWVFGKAPNVHYSICNVIRWIKGRREQNI